MFELLGRKHLGIVRSCGSKLNHPVCKYYTMLKLMMQMYAIASDVPSKQ